MYDFSKDDLKKLTLDKIDLCALFLHAAKLGDIDNLKYILNIFHKKLPNEHLSSLINFRDLIYTRTALHWASAKQNTDIVTFLINYGAHLHLKDINQATYLDLAEKNKKNIIEIAEKKLH